MKLRPAVLIAVLLPLAAAWAAATLYIGHRVEREVDLLAGTLAARHDVRVTRFEYQRNYAGGTLHYDLHWLPPADDAMTKALREVEHIGDDGLRITGTMQMRHGPWAGTRAGIAMAGSEGDVALPEPLRALLPQYPGQAPALKVTAVVTLLGRLELRLAATDYRGAMILAGEADNADIELAGLRGVLRTSSRLDRLGLDLRLDEFSMVVRDAGQVAQIELEDVHVEADVIEARRWVWTGNSRIGLERIAVTVPDGRLEMHEVLATSDSWIEGNKLSYRSAMTAGMSRMDDHDVLGGQLIMSVRDLDVDALVELGEHGERSRAGIGGPDAEPQPAQLGTLFDRILAGNPSLAIERLSLSLASADDLSGRLSIAFEDPPPLSLDAAEQLARALRIEADARVRKDALRHIAGLVAREQQPGATAPELHVAADEMYRQALQTIQVSPFLELSEEYVTVAAELRGGRLLVGGSELMDLDGMIAWLLQSLAARFGTPGGIGDDPGWIDPGARPSYGRVTLGADFGSGPRVIEAIAGGDDDLEQLVGGGCVGWVNGERPDVVLSYAGGSGPLSIRAESDFDTTLAVLGPDGRWYCNDDAIEGAVNPAVELTAPEPGDYAIWLGLYGSGAVAARLHISRDDRP